MNTKNKVINIIAMLIAVVAVGTAAFYAQSERGLAKEYKAQSEELDAVKEQRARQYSILMRIPDNSKEWRNAVDAVNKLTNKQVLDEFAKIGQQEDKAK